ARGYGGAVAQAPECRARRRPRRRMHGERALAANLHKILAQALGLLLRAVGFCDDQEGRAAGPLGGEGGARRLERGAVEVLEGGDEQAVPEHSLDRGAAVDHATVEGGNGQRRLRRGQKPEPRGGDDPEGSFRADQQTLQVVAGDLLPDGPAHRDDLARRYDRLQPGDPGTGDAVLERMRSTRV